MPLKPGVPPGLVPGTAEYAKWFVCKDGLPIVFSRQKGGSHAPKTGQKGT